jgi:hypothetical protein
MMFLEILLFLRHSPILTEARIVLEQATQYQPATVQLCYQRLVHSLLAPAILHDCWASAIFRAVFSFEISLPRACSKQSSVFKSWLLQSTFRLDCVCTCTSLPDIVVLAETM